MLQSSATDVLAQSSAIVSTNHIMAELWDKTPMAELWSMMIMTNLIILSKSAIDMGNPLSVFKKTSNTLSFFQFNTENH